MPDKAEPEGGRSVLSLLSTKSWPTILIILLLAGIIFCVLRYGDPQANKYIYMFQAYVLPGGYSEGMIYPHNLEESKRYSGIWRMWYRNGSLMEETTFVQGLANGPFRHWHENGCLAVEGNGKMLRTEGDVILLFLGKWRRWTEDGILIAEGTHTDDGKEWDGTFLMRSGDGYFKIGIFKEGTKIGEKSIKVPTWAEKHGIVIIPDPASAQEDIADESGATP